VSAAKALEVAKLVAKASEISMRIFPLGILYFFKDYTRKCNIHNAGKVLPACHLPQLLKPSD
jgi:hypothetical protein